MLKRFINPANIVTCQQGVIELDPYNRLIFRQERDKS